MTLASTLLEVRSQKGTEIYVTATYLSLDNRNDSGQEFFLGVSITSLVQQILKFNHQIHAGIIKVFFKVLLKNG